MAATGKESASSPANGKAQPLEKVLSMGKGDTYSQNSYVQSHMLNVTLQLPGISEALQLVRLPGDGTALVVADLGCSSGGNTIDVITFVVEKLRARFNPASPPPDIQAFFNDLPSNDFNHLFHLLSSDPRTEDIFAAAVAGSFYVRLLPSSSVHLFISSNCLHWMSKIPDAVLDEDSPAYNRGKVSAIGSTLAVTTAYKEQALSDLKDFLNARAAELVPGGLLFFLFVGLPDCTTVDDPAGAAWWGAFDDVWDDLILQGFVTEKQRATFNLPIHFRSLEEVQEAIRSCDSAFHVQTAELGRIATDYSRIWSTTEPINLTEKITSMCKSIFGDLLEAHLGRTVTDVYWVQFAIRIRKDVVPMMLIRREQKENVWLHRVSLIRK